MNHLEKAYKDWCKDQRNITNSPWEAFKAGYACALAVAKVGGVDIVDALINWAHREIPPKDDDKA